MNIKVALKIYEYKLKKAAGLRNELYKMGCWVTANHSVIPVEDLSDRHLMNIYRFMYRHAERKHSETISFYASTPGPRGEMAQVAFDQECDWVFDSDPMDYMMRHPFASYLLNEIEKRGLGGEGYECVRKTCARERS